MIHHGLETLFKDILFQKNPIFLLDEKITIKHVIDYYQGFFDKKNNYLFDDAKTITPSDAIKRIRDLRVSGEIPPKDFANLTEYFDKLHALRNQLQHFAIKANPEEIVRILGNLVPRAITLLKACYLQDSYNPYLVRTQVVPHQALKGMAQLFAKDRDIEKDLDGFYPDASKMVQRLEARYDVLLNEAIKKFAKAVFKEIKQSIKISDNGHVGAPPYMPNITLSGWLNETFDPHRNASNEHHWSSRESISADYSATLKIEQPIVKEASTKEWTYDTLSELSIAFESTMSVFKPETFFVIPDTAEYIPFIKSPQIKIQIQLTCEVRGIYSEHHFDIRSVHTLSGSMHIELSSMIYGDTKKEPSILGAQSIPLNQENTSLRFHAFVESNKRLSDHYDLEIIIEGAEDIVFK